MLDFLEWISDTNVAILLYYTEDSLLMARSAESIFNPIPLRPATPRKELKEWGPGGDFVKEGNKKLDADLPTVVYFLRLKDGDNI